jgi:hypothetical protein
MDGGVTASNFFGETCHQMIASYPRRHWGASRLRVWAIGLG